MKISRLRPLGAVAAVLFVAGTAGIGPAGRAAAVSGAVYTTTNPKVDGKGHCQNGNPNSTNPSINCNIYDGKQYVWLNGGPASNGLAPDGRYFFAVLVPGGQPDPNDGGVKNLSDDYDAYTNRTFTVSGGEATTYTGSHDLYRQSDGSLLIRLMPYADTLNPGGVYIMAVCSLATGYPVVPRSCKYDAFKVKPGKPLVQSVLSGYKYRDSNEDGVRDVDPRVDPSALETGLQGWTIHIVGTDGTNANVLTDSTGAWTYSTPLHSVGSGSTTYTISEVLQPGWLETGNTVGQWISTPEPVISLANFQYTVTIPNDVIASVALLNFGNIPPVSDLLSGTKYRDDNKDGIRDLQADGLTPEVGIQQWTINIFAGTNTNVPPLATPKTDAAGNWSYTVPAHTPALNTWTTYTIQEVQQVHWRQTGNTADQSTSSGVSPLIGAPQVTLSSKVYTVMLPNDVDAGVSGLNFGNIPQSTISGRKYYDGNMNGQMDAPESGIQAWKISQGGAQVATLLTDGNGYFSTPDLDPGTYTFTEVQATNGWMQTGNTVNQSAPSGAATLSNFSYTVVVPKDQPSAITGINFGNVCTVTPGGHTMGFWSNKNGAALMTATDLAFDLGQVDAARTGTPLALANADGSYVSLAFASHDAYANWLLSADAKNMSYMLSAQLTATYLAVVHGITIHPHAIVDPKTGYDVIGEIEYANSLLQHDSNTVQSGPDRDEQGRVEAILDNINNSKSFPQPSPTGCAAPIFP